MYKRFVSLISILLIGCSSKVKNTPTIFAPSVRGVKSDISAAQKSTESAIKNADNLDRHISASSSYADRIDAKIQVILKNWPQSRQEKNLEP